MDTFYQFLTLGIYFVDGVYTLRNVDTSTGLVEANWTCDKYVYVYYWFDVR